RTYLGNYSDYLRAAGRRAEAAPSEERGTKSEERVARGDEPAGKGRGATAQPNGKREPAAASAAGEAPADGHADRRARGGEERRRRERQKQLGETERQIGAWE